MGDPGEALAQPRTSPWERARGRPPPGPVPRPSPPPGPGGAACDRVPGSRRAPGPAGACDLRPGSARAERPRAPACDRPPDAAPGPRSMLLPEVASDKGTPAPRSGRRPPCAAAPRRPRAPTCATTLATSGEGPLPSPTFAAGIPTVRSTFGQSEGGGGYPTPSHTTPHNTALGCLSRAQEKRKRWLRASLRSAVPLLSRAGDQLEEDLSGVVF